MQGESKLPPDATTQLIHTVPQPTESLEHARDLHLPELVDDITSNGLSWHDSLCGVCYTQVMHSHMHGRQKTSCVADSRSRSGLEYSKDDNTHQFLTGLGQR
eukprot:Blabericola_migrator_1__8092@NODE_4166_length_1299_cov_66_636364_g2578_i0_p2_GENE_NODE_4166_length_1299_cov_66_636364_g2578_i0NODE_4166_length_1299_cov_66_636364_g2578_i0_p2_ORF_typecomplete_len102_score11_04RESP18/PF14948_6/0_051_NODE_4166_length_1299_cov_66_636364_g2578_i0445750